MPGKWLELSIRASAEAAEALTPVFERAGHGGVVIEPEFAPQKDETDELRPALGSYSRLRAYVPEGKETETRRKTVEDAVGLLRAFDLAPMGQLETRWIDEEDWANAWKRHYSVMRLGRRWVIKPQWQEYAPSPEDRIIEMDPGMAFGTGQHPTTQLVLEMLEWLDDAGEVAGRELLDLGTGSGVLAIAAVRAGAKRVLALDVEEVAARAAGENAARNGARERIEVRHATLGAPVDGVVPVPGIDREAAFDGAFANIVARVIAERAPALSRALRPGAWLLASGIIAEREHEATEALSAVGLGTERREQRGDWVALLCRRG
ncbi:MAG TPA: 50S ribosomal protein L11 methyltransferase [Chloroflexota bacterium]|nr:50S ribosomal protein L11 methyltransferase [Chloroflexota bacterium]